MRGLMILFGLYLVAAPAGFVLGQIGVPLAWMIGPLISTGLLVGTGAVRAPVPIWTRPMGQVVVATFVGAHFSSEAFHSLRDTAPLLIAISVLTLAGALLVAQVQMRIFRTEPVTAVLSVVPTSPVEAGILAESYGGNAAQVIFAQTVRIAMVVLLVPVIVFAFNADAPRVAITAAPVGADTRGLALMIAGAVAGVVLFRVMRQRNPYFLGPLFASAALAALGVQSYVIPDPVVAVAQIILGTWLGSCFRPDLLRSSRTLVTSVLISSLMLLALCCAVSLLLAMMVDVPLTVLLLGAAPGGVTEMALTAGVLGLDVALVTAIHLARMFIIMPSVSWIARAHQAAHQRSRAHKK